MTTRRSFLTQIAGLTACHTPNQVSGIVIPIGSGPVRTLSRAERTARWKTRQEDYLRLVEYARGEP